jgi:hypoxanthine-guanine phosphoribosyltransferase
MYRAVTPTVAGLVKVGLIFGKKLKKIIKIKVKLAFLHVSYRMGDA